jgi:Sulfotransferase domain
LPIFRFNRDLSEPKETIKGKKQDLSRIKKELSATKEQTKITEHRKRKKKLEQEIFQLEREFRTANGRATDELGTGALPDFLIIGAMKAGTTFLYNLLTLHPHVEPAAAKELHYFDNLIEEEDIEWYRRCFPRPRWKDGRRTITGESTPYLAYPHAPERVAEVVPQARLIALLRNPVDRAYSDYQQLARKGRAPRTFEAAIGAKKVRLRRRRDKTSERRDYTRLDDSSRYLSRGIYVDQLLRWSRFFADEQMLVLKSENLFERPQDTLKLILDFLDLPDWEPEAWEKIPKKRNKGKTYEQKMDPATRQYLEGFFEPHNQRLYEYLGVDFGW